MVAQKPRRWCGKGSFLNGGVRATRRVKAQGGAALNTFIWSKVDRRDEWQQLFGLALAAGATNVVSAFGGGGTWLSQRLRTRRRQDKDTGPSSAGKGAMGRKVDVDWMRKITQPLGPIAHLPKSMDRGACGRATASPLIRLETWPGSPGDVPPSRTTCTKYIHTLYILYIQHMYFV